MINLSNVSLSTEDINRRSRSMSHWVAVAKQLYEMGDENAILELLHIELETRNRAYVVRRIYAHYNTIRRQNELKVLETWPNQKKIQSDI